MRRRFFLNSAVFRVLGFVLRLGVCFRGAICFQLARPGGLALGLWVVVFHVGCVSVCLCFDFNVSQAVIRHSAITPRLLPSLRHPISLTVA